MKNSHSLSWHHNFHLMDYCNWTFTSTVHSKTKIMRCFRRWYCDGWSSFFEEYVLISSHEKRFLCIHMNSYEIKIMNCDRWSYSGGLFLFFFKRVCLNFIARKGFLCIHMIPTWIFLFSETFLRKAQMVWQTTQQQYYFQQNYFSGTFFFARR